MYFVQRLDDPCPNCGEHALIWWQKNETEDMLEAYMTCEECGYEFPKIAMSKHDTSDEYILEKLRRMYL